MSVTNIEWTDRVWNPVTGCRKVSPGCKHCYAEGVAHRFWHHQYVHTAERGFIPVKAYAADAMTGTLRTFTDVMTHEDRLLEPLRWKKPTRVFVNSMSDLFHEDVPDAFIDQVFAVMHLAHEHTFQVLTKRPERMRAYLCDPARPAAIDVQLLALVGRANRSAACVGQPHLAASPYWPLPNVWLGVSVEDQERANERIPVLLQTPAAVRFVSAEPLLGPVDFSRWFGGASSRVRVDIHDPTPLCSQQGAATPSQGVSPEVGNVAKPQSRPGQDPCVETRPSTLRWVIVGGESGPGARPCDVGWIRAIVNQCQAASVPVFVKQMGSCITGVNLDGPPYSSPPRREGFLIHWTCQEKNTFGLCNRKGGDPAEWPDDLRVREFPR